VPIVGSSHPTQNLALSPCTERTRDSILTWTGEAVARETKALDRARRRFAREPDPEGLHQVRTGARRLRCLLEDFAGLHVRPRLLRRVKRVSKLTDAARDATVACELLERVLDESERDAAETLLLALRDRERRVTSSAGRKLRRVRFKAKGAGR